MNDEKPERPYAKPMTTEDARDPTVGESLDALIKEMQANLDRLQSLKSVLSLNYLGKSASAFPVLNGQSYGDDAKDILEIHRLCARAAIEAMREDGWHQRTWWDGFLSGRRSVTDEALK